MTPVWIARGLVQSATLLLNSRLHRNAFIVIVVELLIRSGVSNAMMKIMGNPLSDTVRETCDGF